MKKMNDNNKLAIQMLVTSQNVTGDAVACMIVSRSEGKLDTEVYHRQ